ncbi:MAG TPA: ATP-binding protein [Methylomirabilota bacterium]|nr:ATP-binding protein [Methylomirabilota bacterium]
MKRVSLKDLSIRSKLILLGAAPSIVVLVLAAFVFAFYDLAAFRRAMGDELRALAHFIGYSSQPALRFEDQERAVEILRGLSGNRDIVAAVIFDRQGAVFASYAKGRAIRQFAPLSNAAAPAPASRGVSVFEPIVQNRAHLGHIYIESGMERFWRRALILLASASVAVLAFSLLSFLLSQRFQHHISTPLRQLSGAASSVAQNADYTVRVEEQPGPELSVLTRAFNQMLSKIEQQDSTLRQRAAELEAVNKELEAFTYTVSHDLRSPLRAMAGYAQILKRSAADRLTADDLDCVQRIQNNARRMSELIDDLLAFSRLDTQPIEKAPLNLNEIIQRALQPLEPLIANSRAQLLIHPLPPASADAALIEQVFANVLGNAIKYSRKHPNPRIEVGYMDRDGKPIYFVRDNGVGFDMQYADKLFGVFQRLHRADEFEGTGVGLAIVQRIIVRHGGKIWAESSPDKGATFFFTLN